MAENKEIQELKKQIEELKSQVQAQSVQISPDASAMEAFAAAMREGADAAMVLEATQTANMKMLAEINDLQDRSVAMQQRMMELAAKKRVNTSRSQHEARIALELAQEGASNAEQALSLARLKLGENVKVLENAKKSEDFDENQIKALEKQVELAEEVLQGAIDEAVAREEGVKTAEKQSSALNQLEDSTNNVLGMLNLSATAWEQSIFSGILGQDGAGLSAGFNTLASTIGRSLNPANLFAQLMTDIYHQTLMMVGAMDKAIASLNRQTGAAGEMDDVMYEVHAEMGSFGATLSESSEAITSLYTEMATFSNMSKGAQKELAVTVAQLNRLGVSSQVAAKNLETLTMSLGMSGAEAVSAMTDLTMFADQLNISVNSVQEDLNSSMPVLAKYGKDAIKVFKGVAAAAKATGIATQDLLGITEQFDTFQSAAEAVGRLNGILGGNYLNSLEMVNMTEDQRIRKLLGVVQASGKSWDAMSRHEKQAIASAAGIRDMNKANKLFGKGLAGYDEMLAKQEESADAQKRQEEMAKRAAAAQEKLVAIMEQLAVAVKPIIWLMHTITDAIMWLNDVTGNWFIPTLFGLIAVYYWVSKSIWSKIVAMIADKKETIQIMFLMAKDTIIRWKNAAATWAQTTALGAMAIAMLKAAGLVGIMVGAFMLLSEYTGPVTAILGALAAGMIAYGIATKFAGGWKMALVTATLALIAAFVEPHSPPFYLLLPIIALGMWLIGKALIFLTPVLAAAAVPVAIFGKALIIVGIALVIVAAAALIFALAIGIVAAAVSLVIDAFAGLVTAITQMFTVIAENLPELVKFAITLPLLAMFGIPAAIAMTAFAVSIAVLGASLLLVKTEDLQALATMFEAMGKAAEGGAAPITAVADFLEVLEDVADDIDEDTVVALSSIFSSIADLSELDAASIEATSELFEKMMEADPAKVSDISSALFDIGWAVSDLDFLSLWALTEVFDSISMIDTAPIETMITFFDTLQSVVAEEVQAIADAMWDLSMAMWAMPLWSLLQVSWLIEDLSEVSSGPVETLRELNKVVATASNIDDATANNIEKVTEGITNMVLELQGGLFTNTEDTKEILESLAKVFTGAQKGGEKGGGENKIILALDREGQKRLAEAIVPHMEDLINKKYNVAKVRA